MKHIASCSFGKDSMATVILAIENGEPLDEVVYCEVMFTKYISGEIPEHRDFIHNVAIPYVQSCGIKAIILKTESNYMELFFREIETGKRRGLLRGYPLSIGCYVNRDLKSKELLRYDKQTGDDIIKYIGIAADEHKRLETMRRQKNQISLLEKYRKTKKDAYHICEKRGLLSPIYDFTKRNGCFFCPNANKTELRHLYDFHRDIWDAWAAMEFVPGITSRLFSREKRLSDYDYQFKLQDAQISIFDFLKEEP